ncbi:MAG: DUF3489 domain-containing protein [Acidobacteriota bacterium]
MTPIIESTTPNDASKAQKKGKHRPQGAPKTPAKPKVEKKPRAAKKAPAERKGARDGTKTAKLLDLLKRSGGATSKELLKASGWQPHSLRGFLSGTVTKKMGLVVTSTKEEGGERSYAIKS